MIIGNCFVTSQIGMSEHLDITSLLKSDLGPTSPIKHSTTQSHS